MHRHSLVFSGFLRAALLVFAFVGIVGCGGGKNDAPKQNSAADLSSLALINGTLAPPFDPAITAYDATLHDSGATVAVTATAAYSHSSITVQGVPLASGATTAPMPVLPATMNLTVKVTAADGTTSKSYVVVAQLRGWQINATNIGLAGVGVGKNSLPDYTGPILAGATISLKKLTNPDVSAGHIILDRCWIVNTGYGGLGASNNGPVTLHDCDMESQQYQAGVVDQYKTQPMTVLRCNLTGGGCSKMNGPGTIRQSFLHDYISGDGAGGPNHVDGFTRRDGTGQVDIIDCFIDSYTNPNHTSATVFLQSNAYFDNILFQGNLFSNGANGGGNVVLEAKDGNDYGTHLIMNGNRFTYSSKGYGYVLNYNTNPYTHGTGWGQWTNNYVYDPSQSDSLGAIIPEP